MTHPRIIVVMDRAAPQRFPMPAAAAAAAARIVTAVTAVTMCVIAGGVHSPEAGRRKGHEHLGVLGHRGGYVVMSAV